ncbi:HAD family hydrolase [Lentzea californiensis]|uniref:HAD family hydrolase n=1 Tax=Lentzea californiensis TaxID=438851 RepID=UPI00216489B8|nr:HAD hydrolase-like protein [Lentzea californiensis]MCR3747635.1 phosphoglycolate phosphatase [Lentzea californiensis]
MPFTVGFDLDMTLIDPRPGMAAVMNEVGARTGYALDGEKFASNLGPPLDMIYRDMGVPEEEVPDLISLFRALYPEVVIPSTVALPGAAMALQCVRELGGSTMVVTGKYRKNAALHLEAMGWEVDHLYGELWATGKAESLKLHGAAVYVGDHMGDMRGAAEAGALGVGVVTGPCSRAELTEAGAAVVLEDLREFPEWLRTSSGVLS